ncbi:hypothetical protein [Elizabethkingia occulta]|uniref:hypothetical protein n=1 Tax=Elizabethkingia occulta TaxID=1867263 RepID=UPI00398C5E2A
MYKFILIFFVGVLYAQQSCNLQFSNSSLSTGGNIEFIIKNKNKRKMKAPNVYNVYGILPIDIQVFNEEKKQYENTGYSFDDATCLNLKECLGKMSYIKIDEERVYNINLLQGRIVKAFKKNGKYRFKLLFNTHLFSECNNYLTDWLYYQK